LVARLVVHPAPIELIAGPAELVKGQVGVLRPVFEDQNAKWSSSHGDAAMQRPTEQLVASVTGSRDSEPGRFHYCQPVRDDGSLRRDRRANGPRLARDPGHEPDVPGAGNWFPRRRLHSG